MTYTSCLSRLILAVVAGSVSTLRSQNLLVNWSFESPGLPNSGDVLVLPNGSTHVTGWVSVDNVPGGVTADNFYCRDRSRPIGSDHFIYLKNNGSASPTLNGIYQDVPTVPGHTYRVDFSAATEIGGGPGILAVSAAGTTVRFRLPNSGLPARVQPPFPGFFGYTFYFTANAATTRLQFSDEGSQAPGDPAGNASPLLDQVSVHAVAGPVDNVVPSFAGIYRGQTSDRRSEIVISATNGSSATVHVLDYSARTLDWAEFSTFSDGAFSTTTSRGTRMWGRFSGSAVKGCYGTDWVMFARLLYHGNTQSVAGWYTGSINDPVAKNVANLTIMATNQGEAFLLVSRDNTYDAGLGALDATGNFSVPTVSGNRYSGRLAVTNGIASGVMEVAHSGTLPFRLVQQRTGVLQNVSTRGFVGSGDNAMIVGFVVAESSKHIVLRAMGPTLQKFGVAEFLPDPMIQVFDSAGRLLASNDNWGTALGVHPIPYGSGLTDIDAKDAGMTLTLDPGAYTAVVRDAGGSTGVAIVEVYEVR